MLNNVILMGRLTADPELKQALNGVSVVSSRIAVERDFKDKDGKKKCDFINIVAWRNTAEFISKYFHKGSMIVLQGAIQTRNYKDKDCNNRTSFEVATEHVYFGNSKMNDQMENSTQTAFDIGDFEEIDTDDSLPF